MPALSEPVTGSSAGPKPGQNARTSTASGPSAYGPTTPIFRSPNAAQSGSSASTAAASSTSTPTQPGPLSIQVDSTIADSGTRSARQIPARSDASTGPDRTSG